MNYINSYLLLFKKNCNRIESVQKINVKMVSNKYFLNSKGKKIRISRTLFHNYLILK
jgi:hypothetical protein